MSRCYPRKPDAGMTRDDYAMPFEEIAHELGISRERVRQLEANGLAKAKTILEKWGYTLQDLLGGYPHGYSQAKEWVDIDLFLQDLLPDEERHD